MDNTREKLIELIDEAEEHSTDICVYASECKDCPGRKYGNKCREYLKADHLIANGVTIQKWIPVTERLPEDNERVLVYHDDGVIRFGINKDGFADVVSRLYLTHNHRTCFSKVTHWMPLPEPPKGDSDA